MNKLLAALVAGTFAAMSVSALAQPATKTDDSMKKDAMAPDAAKAAKDKKKADFAAKEKALQGASTNMPASAPVNKAAPASDPVAKVPKGATKDEKKAAFKAKEQGLQGAASNAPVESKPDTTAEKLTKGEKKAVSKDVGKGSTGQ
jgi:hypothetical protein